MFYWIIFRYHLRELANNYDRQLQGIIFSKIMSLIILIDVYMYDDFISITLAIF